MLNQNKTIKWGITFILVIMVLNAFFPSFSLLEEGITFLKVILFSMVFASLVYVVKIRLLKSLFNYQYPADWDGRFKKFLTIISQIYAELAVLFLVIPVGLYFILKFAFKLFNKPFSAASSKSLVFAQKPTLAGALIPIAVTAAIWLTYVLFSMAMNGVLMNLLVQDFQKPKSNRPFFLLALIIPTIYYALSFIIMLLKTILKSSAPPG